MCPCKSPFWLDILEIWLDSNLDINYQAVHAICMNWWRNPYAYMKLYELLAMHYAAIFKAHVCFMLNMTFEESCKAKQNRNLYDVGFLVHDSAWTLIFL